MSGDEAEYKNLFLNKTVRLLKSDGFVLTERILRMDKDNILFETGQATSLIAMDNIKELAVKKESKWKDEKKCWNH